MIRFPVYFKQELPCRDTFAKLAYLKEKGINTVCVSAACPNLTACFRSGAVTFMILGDVCSRGCLFCAVKKNRQLKAPHPQEPERIVNVAKALGLRYIVITSVTRDDLPDHGAGHFANVVSNLHKNLCGVKIELLIPDFQARCQLLKQVVDTQPAIIGHNLETVWRLYKEVRPQADYFISLRVLENIKRLNPKIFTKSSLILGMGEKESEVVEVLKDLRKVNCDILTLGQYLSPSKNHYPIKEFISLEQFDYYRQVALSLGFKAVLAGPLVRSSYKAEEIYNEVSRCMNS
ncbi:MAG: lipoyl synthase [Candidatus Omnitrophica bacterium]|nr:lipoyl synthase [Candidatus Omnitrophota bacterium]MCM8770788.1 lipoyl synthase [Candidatus Omnitrophota bacterium]